jgi:hypothetical protein
LKQNGELRTDPRSHHWFRFTAIHTASASAPGFVWEARVKFLPLFHISVLDAYVAGEGCSRVSVLSALTVAAQNGGFEVNSGSLHRYLAEAVWYPTALLPSRTLHWTAIDSTKALATLTDAGVTVSLEFWFNDIGEVTGIYSPGRWGTFGGEYRQARWEGRFRNYSMKGDMLVPSYGEVGWYAGTEWQRVWKCWISEASYEMLP